jgi:DNA-binding CsgD family transcriptional regulator
VSSAPASQATVDSLILALLPLLYEGAVDARNYRPFVAALAKAIGCPAGVSLRGLGDSWVTQTWSGLPEAFERAYVEHYHARDPWARKHAQVPVGGVAIGDSFVPEQELLATDFYRELCAPHGLRYLVAAVIARSTNELFSVAVMPATEHEQARAKVVLEALVPHLTCVHRLRAKVGSAQSRSGEASSFGRLTPSRFPHPVFAVDSDLRLIEANPAGEKLLSSADQAVGSGEVLRLPGVPQTKLRDFVQGTKDATVAGTRVNGAMRSLLLLSFGGSCGEQLLHVIDPEREGWFPPLELLRDLFGLTPTECRVALAIAQGRAPRELADELAMSLSTARVHLHRVLAKTECHRQADLARLILQLGAATIPVARPGSVLECTD